MNKPFFLAFLLPLGAVQGALAADTAADLRRAVPADAYIVVHSRHNPERDYQREYYQEVWNTVRETRIVERAVKIATSRISAADVQRAESVLQELRDAVEPIDWAAILDCKESIYAQSMRSSKTQPLQVPAAQHLVLLRLTPDAAQACQESITNLFGLIDKYANGDVSIETGIESSTPVTTLDLPRQVPFRPTVASVGDVLLLSSSDALAHQALAMLRGEDAESKFNDPRLKEALGRLPDPEDNLTFYDGKRHFSQLRDLGQFIRQVSGGDVNAERVAALVELLFDELSVLDCEVTVEYTDENRNRSAAYGKLLPGAEDKLLAQVLGGGKPFENWQRWVPADALSYSLWTGINLHPVYERVVAVVNQQFPEARSAVEQFAQLQSEYDLHLDRDILQAFSGESVSVSLPAAAASSLGGQDSVMALRCHKPERIRELLHRLVQNLQAIAYVKALQLQLVESEDLDGFDELSATVFALFGTRPVIGFRDGWMIVGSNASAVQRVLDVRAGNGQTIADTDSFKQFNLEIEGPVHAISYANVAESTRRAARLINQVGLVTPVLLGLAGAQSDEDWVQQVQELLGLLPSVAKIVSKFDFFEAKMSVTQAGDEPGTYLRRTVTLVRPKSAD